MTTSYDTFKYYKALRLHFSSDKYDFKKYSGRTKNSKPSDFLIASDRVWFERLTKKYQEKTASFLLANLSENPKTYIRDLCTNEECERTYRKWSIRRKSLIFNFKNDLQKLPYSIRLRDLLLGNQSNIPRIFELNIDGTLSKDTVCIILKLTNCEEYLNESLKDNLLWNVIKMQYTKYLPFVSIKEDYRQIMLDKFGTMEYK